MAAKVESYYTITASRLQPTEGTHYARVLVGRHLTIFEKRDGEWRILWRQVINTSVRHVTIEDASQSPFRHGEPYPDDRVYASVEELLRDGR